jgi:hypothetical protein
MAALLSAIALLSTVNAQAYDAGNRASGAFSYVQPLNTTILDEYNSSPPVYPSRKCLSESCSRITLTWRSKDDRSWWLGGCNGEGPRIR